LCVASNGNKNLVEIILQATNLRRLFDAVVTIEDVTCGKPSPELLLLAAHKIKIAPELCLVYENGDDGIIAAKQAEMQYVDVRNLSTQGKTTGIYQLPSPVIQSDDYIVEESRWTLSP
jgi:beta-phosphoglucomutase-like phosphatase (HAD superfamily)